MGGMYFDEDTQVLSTHGPSSPAYDNESKKALRALVSSLTVGDSVKWNDRETPATVTDIKTEGSDYRSITMKGNRGGHYKLQWSEGANFQRDDREFRLLRLTEKEQITRTEREWNKMPLKRLKAVNTSLLMDDVASDFPKDKFRHEIKIVDGIKDSVRHMANYEQESNSTDIEDWQDLSDWHKIFASARVLLYVIDDWSYMKNGDKYLESSEKMEQMTYSSVEQAVEASFDGWGRSRYDAPLTKDQVINLIKEGYYEPSRGQTEEELIQKVRDM